jgi:hypothetical protein
MVPLPSWPLSYGSGEGRRVPLGSQRGSKLDRLPKRDITKTALRISHRVNYQCQHLEEVPSFLTFDSSSAVSVIARDLSFRHYTRSYRILSVLPQTCDNKGALVSSTSMSITKQPTLRPIASREPGHKFYFTRFVVTLMCRLIKDFTGGERQVIAMGKQNNFFNVKIIRTVQTSFLSTSYHRYGKVFSTNYSHYEMATRALCSCAVLANRSRAWRAK